MTAIKSRRPRKHTPAPDVIPVPVEEDPPPSTIPRPDLAEFWAAAMCNYPARE